MSGSKGLSQNPVTPACIKTLQRLAKKDMSHKRLGRKLRIHQNLSSRSQASAAFMCRLLRLDEVNVSVRASFVLAVNVTGTLDKLATEGMAAAVANLQLCAFAWHIVLWNKRFVHQLPGFEAAGWMFFVCLSCSPSHRNRDSSHLSYLP